MNTVCAHARWSSLSPAMMRSVLGDRILSPLGTAATTCEPEKVGAVALNGPSAGA